MIKSNVTLSQAIAQFDRSPTNPVAEGYRSQRAEILKRFPRDKWPEMRLDDYALGQPAVEDTYCRWLEYKSHWMGSIRGGSAKKLIIYKRKEREGWYFPKAFSNEREAWDRLRSEFSQGQTRILGVSIVIALAIASLFTNFFSSQSRALVRYRSRICLLGPTLGVLWSRHLTPCVHPAESTGARIHAGAHRRKRSHRSGRLNEMYAHLG